MNQDRITIDGIDYVRAEGMSNLPCTCHPEDNPPVPCPHKYALDECRRAAEAAGEVAEVKRPPFPPLAPVMYTGGYIGSSPTSGGGPVGRNVFVGGRILEAD
jgi:hypothetical protein